MNIAIFTESYFPVINGVSTSVHTLTTGLREKGHKVYIFAPGYPNYTEQDENIIRYPYYVLPIHKDYPLAYPYSKKMIEIFSTLDIDVIHTQSPFALGIAGLKIGKKFKIPVVTTNHTIYQEYAHYIPVVPHSISKWWLIRHMRRYCNACGHVITPSKSVKTMLETFGITTPISAVATIPPKIDVDISNPDRLLNNFGIPNNVKILLYVGRIAVEKNLELLIESFASISISRPDTHLVIVGSGPYSEDLKELVDYYGLNERVTFTGFLDGDTVSQFYQISDVFLFPSTTDAQGLVVLEAMHYGLPVVAVNAYGPTEWIVDGENGFLTLNDSGDFTDSVLKLIQDDGMLKMIGGNAGTHARKFKPSDFIDMILGIYGDLIEKNEM